MSSQSAQPTQTNMAEALKQMNATLQGYAAHFMQQDKNPQLNKSVPILLASLQNFKNLTPA